MAVTPPFNFRFTIFHRTLLMSLSSIAILLIALGFVLNSVSNMVRSIEGNTAHLQIQTAALNQQNDWVSDQQRLINLQGTTLEAYAFYSAYLYWSFDLVLTTSDRSQTEVAKAEKSLRLKLQEISTLDQELAEAAEVVVIYLNDFNDTIAQAVQRTKDDASKHRISAKVNEAQTHSLAMNAMFDAILERTVNAVKEANQAVKSAGDKVSQAADQVLLGSGQVTTQGHQLTYTIWIVMAIASMVSLILGIVIARSITTPIRQLTSVIIDIDKNSDLNRRINYQGNNEVGDIGNAFNAMLKKFHLIIEQLARCADQLSQSSQTSAQVSETTNNSAQNLRQETDLVATATGQMATTVKEVNLSTDDAVKQASQAQQACRHGQQLVSNTMSAIKTLSNQINDSSNAVQNLAKESDAIGSVLDVIRGIANQTNLLALNAAIEAARAGEQGRGFAVVADEVRSLASKTSESTDEIQKMIEQLQTGATSAVAQMELNSANANQTLTEAAKTTDSISGILQSVSAINETNQQIALSTEEQSVAAQSIDHSIIRISKLTNDVSSAAEHTSQASDQLNNMIDELHHLVVKFKY